MRENTVMGKLMRIKQELPSGNDKLAQLVDEAIKLTDKAIQQEVETYDWMHHWYGYGRCQSWKDGPCHPACSLCKDMIEFNEWQGGLAR